MIIICLLHQSMRLNILHVFQKSNCLLNLQRLLILSTNNTFVTYFLYTWYSTSVFLNVRLKVSAAYHDFNRDLLLELIINLLFYNYPHVFEMLMFIN